MALSKIDINKIQDLLEDQEEKFERKIVEVKSDFLEKIDPILKEVVASREERAILSQHSKDQIDRIEALEKIHPQGKHLAAT